MLDAQTFVDSLLQGMDKTTVYAYKTALSYSSGKYRSKMLAKMGYPYAIRNSGALDAKGRPAVPYGDPAVINFQKGDFYRSWMINRPKRKGDTIEGSITNIDPAADKLARGIPRLTMRRPLMDRVTKKTLYWRDRNVMKAVVNAITAHIK